MKNFSQYHILVIDDDNRLRDLLQQYLTKNNFLVSTAENTKNARRQMQNYIFDLLVVDVMMPEENGMDFVLKLRKEEKNTIPVLMLTAMGETDSRIKGLERGADDYLVKPFEPKELVLRIKSILARTNKSKANNIINFGEFNFNLKNLQLKRKNDVIYLTDNEANLLNIFCKNLGKLLSREDLCRMCDDVNERSIDVQITRLRKKIEDNIQSEAKMEFVRKLVRTKSTRDIENNLFSACGKEGNLKSVKTSIEELKQKKTDINTIIYSNGWTPLLLAFFYNHTEIINFLIEEGMNINVKTTDGFTPLFYAVKNNNLKLTLFLIEKGLNINEKNINGDTPLHYAFSDNIELDIIELLIKEGADINAINNDNETPFDLAEDEKYKNIVELLKKRKGRIVNLFSACKEGKLDVIIKLIIPLKQKEININIIKYKYGNNLLHCACSNKKSDIINFLIKQGIDLNIRNNNRETPLHKVSFKGNLEIAEILINNGANVNARDKNYNTPLHFAVLGDKVEMFNFLLGQKANVKAKNKSGKTPWDLIRPKLCPNIIKFLEEKEKQKKNTGQKMSF